MYYHYLYPISGTGPYRLVADGLMTHMLWLVIGFRVRVRVRVLGLKLGLGLGLRLEFRVKVMVRCYG